MKKRRQIYLILFLIININLVLALTYEVQVNSPVEVNKYEGETIQNIFSVIITNNGDWCDISCIYETSFNTHNYDNPKKISHDGGIETLYFDVEAEGVNGEASYTLTITCERISTSGAICAPSPDSTYRGPYSFTFLYQGDGRCTVEREKCESYLSFLEDSACTCSNEKQCIPTSIRGSDDRGCATYCGNNIVETDFEDCSNCDIDVGKCDGLSCLFSDECEGTYCVHEICSSKSYIESDSFCDIDVGENCKNSVIDCACSNNERCNSGVCKTYCGNGVCEESEVGVCEADCKWCGDGNCESSKGEACGTCETDCGVCENTKLNQEISEKTQEVVNKGLETATQRQKKITYFALGAIIIFVIGYILFKFTKQKRHTNKEKPKKKK